MAKNNYAAWHINSNEFSDAWPDIKKLHFFARYAILAPSGHNTQPWHFTSTKDALTLSVSPSRNLPFSGALAAEPHVSLGACLETLRLAAQGFGYEAVITYTLRNNDIATIGLSKRVVADPSLLTAITGRVSNRHFFKDERLDKTIVQYIINHTFKHVSAQSVHRRADIDFLASQTRQATENIMTEAEFRNELSKWVRNNITKQHDGMPGFVQGMPTPPSLLARHIVRRIDISKGQAKIDAERVKHSAEVILLSAHSGAPQAFIEVGRLYARICVLARQQGLDSSGVGAAVIDLETKKTIAKHFGLPHQPTALIRLGHADTHARHTPRWPLAKVLD